MVGVKRIINMPTGPAGVDRPLASSSLSIEIELNSEFTDDEVMDALSDSYRIMTKADQATITSGNKEIGDEMFPTTFVGILLDDKPYLLSEINDIVTELEENLNTEKLGVEVQAV